MPYTSQVSFLEDNSSSTDQKQGLAPLTTSHCCCILWWVEKEAGQHKMITPRSPSDIPLTCHLLYLGRVTTLTINPTPLSSVLFFSFCTFCWIENCERVLILWHYLEKCSGPLVAYYFKGQFTSETLKYWTFPQARLKKIKTKTKQQQKYPKPPDTLSEHYVFQLPHTICFQCLQHLAQFLQEF